MNSERSSGVATVMFTDVEASTDLTTRLGDDAADALFTAHHGIVRDLIAAHGGRNVESTGDGFMVPRPERAPRGFTRDNRFQARCRWFVELVGELDPASGLR
jgi:class 3 adenylate cyclase